MKALVVDNNPVILKILSHILQTRGLLVHTAKDGLSALKILDYYQPDIIFTDLIMPNLDGESLCRIIKAKGRLLNTLIIVVSAIAVEDTIDFMEFGAHACIAKGPASEMAASIDTILSHIRNDRIDLIEGKKFGIENLTPRTIAKELMEAKRHFKILFDNIDNGILELSGSGLVINCNSFASSLFGRKVLEILSTHICDLFSNDAYKHVCDCLKSFQSSCMPVQSKHPVMVGNKHIVFKMLHMPESDNATSLMILRDITSEHLARQKLTRHLEQLETLVAEKTQKYEVVNKQLQEKVNERKKINEELEFVARQWSNTFDTISDFVSVHDKDMKFVRINKSLADFLGADPENLMGKYCYEVMHGRNKPWENCPHISSIEQRRTVTFEVLDDKIGIPLLVTCSPLMHDDGSPMGTVHVARDISEQKKESRLREELIRQLEESLAKVKLLSGFIPICASCKNIRDDKGYWKQVEEYIRDHSEAEFSHSICPDCIKKLYPDLNTKK